MEQVPGTIALPTVGLLFLRSCLWRAKRHHHGTGLFFCTQRVEPSAAAEIGQLDWFTLEDYLQQTNRAPGAVMILEQLKADGWID